MSSPNNKQTKMHQQDENVTNALSAHPNDDSFRLETPPSVRNGRRKRTSPRDHAILETAYLRNSKPGKDERMNLVSRVDLTEKEVQIWFQNRRQNDRRKSRPLQPHELIPHFRNGIPNEATRHFPSPQASQTKEEEKVEQLSSRSSPRVDIKFMLNNADDKSATPSPSTSNASLITPPSSLERCTTQAGASAKHVDVTQAHAAVAEITKKRSHGQMNGAEEQAQLDGDSPKDPKALRRSASFVRLAVSADGSVKVRVNDETTPSPEKPLAPAPPHIASRRSSGLTRAQSDVSSSFNFRDANGLKQRDIGRSRDARTWEFYCDRLARPSLAERAEQAATGSATGAIGLMRQSQRRTQALAQNSTKQNNLRRISSGINAKPTLARTRSSMARLQSSDDIDENSAKPARPRRQNSSSDSDKENWAPGTRGALNDLRRIQPSVQRGGVLQSSTRAEHGHPSPVLPGAKDQENRAPSTKGKAKGEDLDCVQGLLSLSQGAWR